MKNVYFFLAFLFLCISVSAQPVFGWATDFGGSGAEYGDAIGLDANENIYVCGQYDGTCDFDPGPGMFTIGTSGYNTGYIAKYDPLGNFLWARKISGDSANQCAIDLVVEPGGDVYITGYFQGSADFDPGAGVTILTAVSNWEDIFVCKFDANGNFVWAHSAGSMGGDHGNSIALDNAGHCFVGGYFSNTIDFDPGPGTLTFTGAGLQAFVWEFDTAGNFITAVQLGGSFDDRCSGIVTDDTGNVYLCGNFSSTADLEPGPGVTTFTSNGMKDVYVCKLTPALALDWVVTFGGSGQDYATDIALDPNKNVLITGDFENTIDIDPGASMQMLTSNGSWDIFALKLTNNGTFVHGSSFGSSLSDYSDAVSGDQNSNIYLTGTFQNSIDADPGIGSYMLNSAGSYDAHLIVLSPAGNLLCAGEWGGPGFDHCNGVYVLGNGKTWLTGPHAGGDLDPGPLVYNVTASGNADAYLIKINNCLTTLLPEESDHAAPVIIVPNPNSGVFKVRANDNSNSVQIAVFNTNGQQVPATIRENGEVDLNDAPPGLYLVRVSMNHSGTPCVFTSRIIVE